MWMAAYGIDPTQCTDFCLRVDQHSKQNQWEKAKQLSFENKSLLKDPNNVPDHIKESCKSVILQPLLNLKDISKIHGEPMHCIQGVITHFITDTLNQLDELKIEGKDDFFYEEAEKGQQRFTIPMARLSGTAEWRSKQVNVNNITMRYRRAFDELEQAREDPATIQERIQQLESNLRDIEAELQSFLEATDFVKQNLLIRGAEEIDEMFTEAENDDTMRMTKPAFIFKSSVRAFAGKFTVMHSQMEMSRQRGHYVLEAREDVYNHVVNGHYSRASLKNSVKKIMDNFLKLANHLYPISMICFDQKKQTDEQIDKYHYHIVEFVKLWETYTVKRNPMFYKLHNFLCCTRSFLLKFGNLGLFDAQSFESKHYEMAARNKKLMRLPTKKLYVQKLNERSQVLFNEQVMECHAILEEMDEKGKLFVAV